MPKKMFTGLLLCFLIVLTLTGEVNATPIMYDVTGDAYLNNENGIIKNEILSGSISIDDNVIATPLNESYQITSFNIILGESEYSFYGSSGGLYRSMEDEFFFFYGDGDWDYWMFDNCINNLGLGLPDQMLLRCGGGYPQDKVFLHDGFHIGEMNIDLTRNTPVPEPATMILFGTGLIGLIGFNRKRYH